MEIVLPDNLGTNLRLLAPLNNIPGGTTNDDFFIEEFANEVRIPFINKIACVYGARNFGLGGWGIVEDAASFNTISGNPGLDNTKLVLTLRRELSKLGELATFNFTRFIDTSLNEYFLIDVTGNVLEFDRDLNGNTLLIEASGTVVHSDPLPINISARDNLLVYLTNSPEFSYPINYTPHPIGDKQRLRIGSLELELKSCDFNGEFIYSGYRRSLVKDLTYKIEHLPIGSIAVSGRKFRPRYSFEWDLILSFENLSQLEAIKQEQEIRIRGYNNEIGIELIDGRMGLLEQLPRQRAKARQSINQLAPLGYEYITPVFNIYISEIDYELFLPSKNLWRVKLLAQELDIITPNFDII